MKWLRGSVLARSPRFGDPGVAQNDCKTSNQLGSDLEYSIQHFSLHNMVNIRVRYRGE